MPVVRIVAKYVEDGIVDDENKFYLLASLNDEKKIVSGEWVGYFMTEGRKHPFIMDPKGTLWYDQTEEVVSEDTNLLYKTVAEGEFFSFNINTEDESTYKIVSVFLLP